MPGLYGIYSISVVNEESCTVLLNNIGQKLFYFPNYKIQSHIIGNTGIGRVDINTQVSRQIYHDPINKLTIALWGSLFRVDGNDLDYNKTYRQSFEEQVARLYLDHGEDCVERLNGDFNCVLYDENRNKLVVFNDRFGFRHLYYYSDSSYFLFAPALKAFLCYTGFNKGINWQSISDYLRYGFVLGDRTLFQNIHLLPPATLLAIDCHGLRKKTYWTGQYTAYYDEGQISSVAEEGVSLFTKSAQNRIAGNSNILIYLSGGLDSRLIAGVVSREKTNITSATLGNSHSYEYRIARKVCRTLGISHHRIIPVQPDWLRKYAYRLAASHLWD